MLKLEQLAIDSGPVGETSDASGVFARAAEETTMSEPNKTLYARLGGYDGIAAVANDLVSRLNKDSQLGRFWAHRGED